MKKTLVMLVALIATMTAFADNIALNKPTKATSGDAALAVDGNEGTRWESEQGVDPQTWQVDLGSAQEFESIQILWEGAYAKTFTIEAGNDIDADGYLTGGTVIVSKSDVDLAGQMKQTYTLDAPVTARYVKFTGTERATPYGYSFFEFRVLTPSAFPNVPIVSGADVLPIYTAGETAPGYAFYDWGGGTGTTEIIGEASAYKISNFQWFGSQFVQTDVSNKQYLHYDIYPLQDMTLAFVMINRNAADTGNDGEKGIQKTLTANQWNAIDIPVQDYLDKGAAMSRLYQIKYVSQVVAEGEGIAGNDGFANGDGSETFLIGNVYFYGTRVLDTEAPVLVTAELDKVVDTDVTLRLMATDNNSKVTFAINDGTNDYTVDGTSGEEVTYTITDLLPETAYTFTVIAKDVAGNESQSKTVDATTGTAFAVTAAPEPDKDAADVLSIYSDAYTPATAYTYGGWGQSTVVTDETVGTDNLLHLTNYNYLGFEYAEDIDLADMQYIHIDILPLKATGFGITPIMRGGLTEKSTSVGDLTVKEWNSIDLPLADFGFDLTYKSFQLKIDGGNASDVYVDNIYFWKEASSVTPDPVLPAIPAATAPTADAEYVQGIYTDAYTTPAGIQFMNWHGADVTAEEITASDNPDDKIYRIYTNKGFGFYGMQLDKAYDLSTFKTIHVDIWSSAAATIGFSPINQATEPHTAKKELTLAEGWNQFDINITDYSDMNVTTVDQLEFFDAPADIAIGIDNIFFESDNVLTSIRSVANGNQSVVNGKIYDLQGREVRNPQKGIYIIDGIKVVIK